MFTISMTCLFQLVLKQIVRAMTTEQCSNNIVIKAEQHYHWQRCSRWPSQSCSCWTPQTLFMRASWTLFMQPCLKLCMLACSTLFMLASFITLFMPTSSTLFTLVSSTLVTLVSSMCVFTCVGSINPRSLWESVQTRLDQFSQFSLRKCSDSFRSISVLFEKVFTLV